MLKSSRAASLQIEALACVIYIVFDFRMQIYASFKFVVAVHECVEKILYFYANTERISLVCSSIRGTTSWVRFHMQTLYSNCFIDMVTKAALTVKQTMWQPLFIYFGVTSKNK